MFRSGSVSSVESVGPLVRHWMIECFAGSAETDRTDPFSSVCAVFTPSKWACLCRQMLKLFNWPINMRSEDLWQKKTGAAVVKEELKAPGKPENHKSSKFLKIGN